VLGRRDVSDQGKQAFCVEPGDPFEDGEFNLAKRLPPSVFLAADPLRGAADDVADKVAEALG